MIETLSQPNVGRIFTRLIEQKKLASSYLFYGTSGSGKWFAALEIAAQILSGSGDKFDATAINRVKKLIHPDLKIVFPMPSPKNPKEKAELVSFFRESKIDSPYLPVNFGRVSNILKDNVRDFQDNLSKSSVEGGYRVAIIEKAETMPKNSFDILLKTIEEPPPDSLIMLLSDNIDRLPDTIRSRCQKIRFKRVGNDIIIDYLIKEKELDPDHARFIASLSFGSFSRADKLVDSDFFDERETALMLLGYLHSNPIESFWIEFQNMINLRDKSRIDNLLMIWQTLYHDISIITSGAGSDHLINKDQEKNLTKIAKLVGSFENSRNGLANLLSLQRIFYRNLNPIPAFFETAERMKSNLPQIPVRD
jgi:DNA polymerase III subunit delta'